MMSLQEPREQDPSDYEALHQVVVLLASLWVIAAQSFHMRIGSKACLFPPGTMRLSPLQFNLRILWTSLAATP